MGRLCAVLRLGERPDRTAPRRRILAAPGDPHRGAGPRVGLRDGPGVVAAGPRGRDDCRGGSVGRDARPGAPPTAPFAIRFARAAREGRHPGAALQGSRAVSSRPGAVRHSAIPPPRPRPEGDAAVGGFGAGAGRHVRHRSRARAAGLGGVPASCPPQRTAGSPRAATHAHRVGPAGPRSPHHDVRSGVRRARRRRSIAAPVFDRVQDTLAASNAQPFGAIRLRDRGGARRLPGTPLGCACRSLDPARAAAVTDQIAVGGRARRPHGSAGGPGSRASAVC